MNPVTPVITDAVAQSANVTKTGNLSLGASSPAESFDVAQFQAAMQRYMNSPAGAADGPAASGKTSLGDKIIGRTSTLASEIQKDQQYVSRMLEQATRNADTGQLMKAMMALNDYQMRVQFISKTASKATSSLDQLTKLQ